MFLSSHRDLPAADHSVAGGKKSTFDASSSALSLIAGLIPGIVS
jgi:hypothetical protein